MSGSLAAPIKKETKAQKVERLKREKNPWAALEEIKEFARLGRDSVLPEWASTYFKWWGIYTQGDGAGATGGTGGEGKATPFFMLRIALPNGLLRSDQLRAISSLSERYGALRRGHHRPPEYSASLANDRIDSRGNGNAGRGWAQP